MTDPDMTTVRADELIPGDLVDLENDPHEELAEDEQAEYLMVSVEQVGRVGDKVAIGYANFGRLFQLFHYEPGHRFEIVPRDIEPERFDND